MAMASMRQLQLLYNTAYNNAELVLRNRLSDMIVRSATKILL
jgi:hypothetical protein